jgi:hypothetical protein
VGSFGAFPHRIQQDIGFVRCIIKALRSGQWVRFAKTYAKPDVFSGTGVPATKSVVRQRRCANSPYPNSHGDWVRSALLRMSKPRPVASFREILAGRAVRDDPARKSCIVLRIERQCRRRACFLCRRLPSDRCSKSTSHIVYDRQKLGVSFRNHLLVFQFERAESKEVVWSFAFPLEKETSKAGH